jgi:hypothetical protein
MDEFLVAIRVSLTYFVCRMTYCYTILLYFLQGNLPESRKAIVLQAFKKLDKTGDGVVTMEDLK